MAPKKSALVGREAELAVVDEGIDAAELGWLSMVLCTGEAGIGKTRLAEELAARASSRGFATAWGIADDSVGTPPHWPWIQILRSLTAEIDLHEIARARRLDGELARLLPDVFGARGARVHPIATPEDRFRLFDAVSTILRDASATRPIALVVDDAHWADEESILLLRHGAVTLAGARLVLWVNTRTGDRDEAFEWWSRFPGTRELRLAGLETEAVREQLESLTGRAVTESEAARVRSETGGNPLFVREGAGAQEAERAARRAPPVTAGVRRAIGARMRRLSVASQELLRVAAVLGREFDVAVLAVITGTPELECVEILDEAGRADIIERGGTSGSFRFVHALVRDAIEAGLSSTRQVKIHRAAAEAIAARYGDETGPHVFEIAQHWARAAAAGERVKAAVWLARAADLAMTQLGYEEAARLYEEALAVGGADVDRALRCRVLLRAAEATNRSGALGDCHRCRMAAVEAAPADVRLDIVADAALVMDPVGQPGFDLATRRLCEEALAALGSEPSARRARLTARFAETFIYLPDSEAAERASAEAVEVAEASHDDAAIIAAWRARQVVVAHPARLDERPRVADRLVEVGRASGDADVELRGHLCRVDAFFELGLLGRISRELDVAATLADEARSPIARYLVMHTRAVLAQAQGRVSEARRLSDDAIARGGWGDHPEPTYRRAAVLSGIARHAGTDDVLLPAVTTTAGPKPPFIADLSAAHTMAALGLTAEASDLWQSLGPPAQWDPPSHVVLLGAALGIETATALCRDDDVDALAARLERYRGHHVTCGLGAANYLGPVELWLGKAALRLGRTATAIAELSDAVRRSRESGAAGSELEATCDLAVALLREGDSDAATDLVRTSLPIAEQLGLVVIAERLRRLTHAPVSARDLLTQREREVASLVALGLSNREIAHHLVVSERTAQNHVQHILTKLGLRNRTQIARWFESRR